MPHIREDAVQARSSPARWQWRRVNDAIHPQSQIRGRLQQAGRNVCQPSCRTWRIAWLNTAAADDADAVNAVNAIGDIGGIGVAGAAIAARPLRRVLVKHVALVDTQQIDLSLIHI